MGTRFRKVTVLQKDSSRFPKGTRIVVKRGSTKGTETGGPHISSGRVAIVTPQGATVTAKTRVESHDEVKGPIVAGASRVVSGGRITRRSTHVTDVLFPGNGARQSRRVEIEEHVQERRKKRDKYSERHETIQARTGQSLSGRLAELARAGKKREKRVKSRGN